MALTNKLSAIGDAIREKTGTVDLLKLDDMPSAIQNISSGGGVEEYFTNPPRNDYNVAKIITKIPSIDISGMTSLEKFFYDCVELTEIEYLDTSKITSMSSTFYNCQKLKTIPPIDTSKVGQMGSAFQGCSSLESLPLLDLSKAGNIGSMLGNCSNLTTLGGFKNLGLGFSTSSSAKFSPLTLTLSGSPNLTHESLMNVINNLYDIGSRGVKTQYVVLGAVNKAKLTAEELAIITSKGWTVY